MLPCPICRDKVVAQYVPQSHLKLEWTRLMSPDASGLFCRSCVTQIPPEESKRGVSAGDIAHEPMQFITGVFKELQLRWVTGGKEMFAVLSEFRRLDCLLRREHSFSMITDLTYIIHPEATEKISKDATRRLQRCGA